ncbi:FAD-dependent oxidoreductase [Schlesneria paludicola]|uniref:FAD-dependent oxidoreductase n=1 Tax=Schlesneria paludicola TaxID=360056 RepID=UPI00029AA287|nr:FAD-dependent oxidoreductase [Schlesneria paludicola]
MKLLIVGGVAGGASAAARARRLREDAEIIVFERGPDVSFANCGLPYYVGGVIAEREKLLVTTAERLRIRFNLDVRTGSSVESIDRVAKTVRVRDLATGREYNESYDKLILSPGAAPVRPKLPGVELPGILTLRNLEDVDRIKRRVDEGIQRVVLVGGGFIGLELAENFVKRGVATTLIEHNKQLLPPFDPEMTTPIVQTLLAQGVDLQLGESVTGFTRAGNDLIVELKSGTRIHTQLVVLGIGVSPENKLALESGLETGVRGGIRVDAHQRTSDSDIFAAGDAVEIRDAISGNPFQVPLAGPANRQGRIAADNACGRDSRYRGTQGTAILGVFDQTAAMTGASEKALKKAGRPFRKIYVHPAQHAGYYPGAKPMALKVLFDPENGRILGAQAVGSDGVDKRIDVIAVAIQAGMTVFDMEEMELAYAPQYGSAKDPINMAGFVASGILRGDHPQIDLESVMHVAAEPRPYLIDVRTPQEFSAGAIPGAMNLPVDELRKRLHEIPRDRHLAVYCQVGQRGYLATRILIQNGFSVANIGGGYKTYKLFYPNE